MTQDLFKGGGKGGYVKCCHSHPELELGMGKIVGASCGQPREGYDIYIGLCYTMKFKHQVFPWEHNGDPIIEFQYNITDGCAPGKPKDFKKMINWVSDQLDDGKTVHVGCIGGHGRTGTFLAALVSLYEDLTDDPIGWVRKNHCKKAVESESQLKFLKKHFGCKIKGHKPSKPSYTHTSSRNKPYTGMKAPQRPLSAKDVVVDIGERITPMAGKGSIWG